MLSPQSIQQRTKCVGGGVVFSRDGLLGLELRPQVWDWGERSDASFPRGCSICGCHRHHHHGVGSCCCCGPCWCCLCVSRFTSCGGQWFLFVELFICIPSSVHCLGDAQGSLAAGAGAGAVVVVVVGKGARLFGSSKGCVRSYCGQCVEGRRTEVWMLGLWW